MISTGCRRGGGDQVGINSYLKVNQNLFVYLLDEPHLKKRQIRIFEFSRQVQGYLRIAVIIAPCLLSHECWKVFKMAQLPKLFSGLR
jgi:hypothetical protein